MISMIPVGSFLQIKAPLASKTQKEERHLYSASSVVAAGAVLFEYSWWGGIRPPPPRVQYRFRSLDFCFQSLTLYPVSYLALIYASPARDKRKLQGWGQLDEPAAADTATAAKKSVLQVL